MAGTGLEDWMEQRRIKCSWRGVARERLIRVGGHLIKWGPIGHNECLGFAVGRMGVTCTL